MARRSSKRATAFSLVELVVVIVIIGILAAIAVPRLSRGSAGASQSAVAANLSTLRAAVELYAAEHGGKFPGPDADGFVKQLTMFTAFDGTTSTSKSTTYKFGPYVLAIPPCPVGENAAKPTAADVLIIADGAEFKANPASGEGWIYKPSTGEIAPNTDQTDDSGNPFSGY